MSTAARHLDPNDLGAATEARIAEFFADRLILSAPLCAKLLGETVRTLRTMTDEGLIRAVRKGKGRGYTEADVRRFLAESPHACRPDPKNKRPAPATGGKVYAFTQRPGARRSHERL